MPVWQTLKVMFEQCFYSPASQLPKLKKIPTCPHLSDARTPLLRIARTHYCEAVLMGQNPGAAEFEQCVVNSLQLLGNNVRICQVHLLLFVFIDIEPQFACEDARCQSLQILIDKNVKCTLSGATRAFKAGDSGSLCLKRLNP